MTRSRFALFAGAVALFAVASNADAQSASIVATANVQTPLTVTKGYDLNFTTVFPGVAKTVSPATGGAASAAASQVTIAGQANAEVAVSFVLPTALSNGGATMPLSFSAAAGCWNTAFNQSGCTTYDPSLTLTQRLHATSGNMYVWLGGTVTPAANQVAGTYTANVTMNVAYTGL